MKKKPTPQESEIDSLKQYLDSLKAYPPLDPKEEKRLGFLSLGGDKAARDTLCQHNLLLVYSICLRYKTSGVEMLDLLQEGALGLMRALQDFDPKKGRLSTHASFRIESYLRAATRSNMAIKVPQVVYYRRKRVERFETTYYADHARKPTDTETCSLLGITPKELADVRLVQMQSVASLDAQQGASDSDGEPLTLKDTVAAPVATEGEAVMDIRSQEIRQIVAYVLTTEERAVIELHYGFDGSEGLSLNQVAQRLGRKYETVVVRHRQALKKLRAAMRLTAFAA